MLSLLRSVCTRNEMVNVTVHGRQSRPDLALPYMVIPWVHEPLRMDCTCSLPLQVHYHPLHFSPHCLLDCYLTSQAHWVLRPAVRTGCSLGLPLKREFRISHRKSITSLTCSHVHSVCVSLLSPTHIDGIHIHPMLVFDFTLNSRLDTHN